MTIQIGFVGCGFIARFHAFALRTCNETRAADARVVAACDTDEARAREFAAEWGAGSATTCADEVFDRADIDAVWITAPTGTHAELVPAAAAAGKAIFCEKPVAFDGTQAAALADAVESAGVPNQAGLVLRYSPTYEAIRVRLHGADTGRLLGISLRDDQFFPIVGHYGSTWRKDAAVAGSGVLLEHSIHDIDILRRLGGPLDAVAGRTRNMAGHPGIEDVAQVAVEFASGAVGTLLTLWHDIRTRPSQRNLEVFCEDTLLATVHDMVGPVVIESSKRTTTLAAPEVVDEQCARLETPSGLRDLLVRCAHEEDVRALMSAYILQVWAFLDAVAAGSKPQPDLRVAAEAHDLLDKVYRSADSAGAVTVA